MSVPQNALYSIKLRQPADLILVEDIPSQMALTTAEHTKGGGKSKVVFAGESISTPSLSPWHLSTSVYGFRTLSSNLRMHSELLAGAASTWPGAIDGPYKGGSLCSVLSTGLDRHLSSQVSPSKPGLPCRGSELSPPVTRARLQ